MMAERNAAERPWEWWLRRFDRIGRRWGALATRARARAAPFRAGLVGTAIFLTFALLVVAMLSMRFSGDNNGWKDWYAPRETKIGLHSSVFCSSVTLTNPSNATPASLYVLRGKPTLSARYNFTLVDSPTLNPGYYKYWNFYMYPGSSYSLSSCLTSGSIDYYLIKGADNFLNWHRTDGYSFFHMSYSSVCGVSNKTHSLSFTDEDEYYFVLYNPYAWAAPARVQVRMAFNRTDYLPESGGVISSCSAPPTSQCTLPVPHSTDQYEVLIETGDPQDGNWGARVGLDTTCSPRVWVYVLIVLFPTLAAVALAGCVAGVCCCLRRSARRYGALPSVAMGDAVPLSTMFDGDSESSSANPPPYTRQETKPPAYEPNPPPYAP